MEICSSEVHVVQYFVKHLYTWPAARENHWGRLSVSRSTCKISDVHKTERIDLLRPRTSLKDEKGPTTDQKGDLLKDWVKSQKALAGSRV